jgi:putative DNA primase/helicase
MTDIVLAAALAYAANGWAVFPAPPGAKRSYKCAARSAGIRWGATRTRETIRQDFRHWRAARIGIPTGIDNGIVVVETDTVAGHGVDGAASLAALVSQHGPLPETLQAISPSGSGHRYFQHPGDGIKIKNSASELGNGIDVRGDGGMVIAPPSINPDGRAYRWLNENPIAAMPAWLVELTREKPRTSPTISQRAVAAIIRPTNGSASASTGEAYGQAALEYEITALAQTPPGNRNHQLNRASFNLHQLVGGGELDGGEVDRHLIAAATANGLVNDDGLRSVEATIESGRRAGLQYPRNRTGRS